MPVKLGAVLGLGAIAITASTMAAQTQRAPRISISTGSYASNYIEPRINLSEDAYMLVISVDLDRTVRVLHPELPGITVRMNAQRNLHLPRFFAGFVETQRNTTSPYGNYASSSFSYDPGYSDTRGTIIALASRRPFNLDAVVANGDWDMSAFEWIIRDRDPQSAATALAQHLGARGEPIGRDFYRFAGRGHNYTSLYNASYYGCNPNYTTLAYYPGYPGINSFRAGQLQQAGYNVRFIGVDACGFPRYTVDQQSLVTRPTRPPAVGAFPPSRRPNSTPSRNPASGSPAPNGTVGTSTQSTGFPEARVIPRTVPSDRTADRQFPSDRAQQPARGSFPERTRPTPAEPRERAEPAKSSPPPERPRPVERQPHTPPDRPTPVP
jgi:hypothetical protein